MHWIIYFFLSLPVAIIGLLGGGLISSACVSWYHIPGREGGSGYFVIFMALLGAIVGLVTGLVIAGVMSPQNGMGYLKTFGVSVGAIATIAAVVTGLCWGVADIPPKIDGRPLVLHVEVMLPVDVKKSPANGTGGSSMSLHSSINHRSRGNETGALKPDDARLEKGRWVVPGEVELFTMRGLRSIGFKLNGGDLMGFIVPLPARPGKKFLEWSDWGPRPPAGYPAWPDTNPSYRFRVQKIPEPPPGPTIEEIEAKAAAEEQTEFDAVKADAPIVDWFPYVRYGAREDRRAIAIKNMTAKPDFLPEMRELMLGEKADDAAEALRLFEHLPAPSKELIGPVTAVGKDIAERIRKVNASTVEQDPHYDGAADVSIRFSAWMVAIIALREKAGGDFAPELKTILELSRARPDSHCMRMDVCRVASYYMKEWAGLEPLATDPKPR